jgi:mono/diheme cytochrome c family protein
LALLAGVVLPLERLSHASDVEDVTFEQQVRAILKANCFDCHGEGDKLRGGVDLRLRRLMLQGGDNGPILVPGAPEQSRLYQLLRDGEMPKRDKKLDPAQIEVVRRWIARGAPTSRPEPENLHAGMQITEEERAHWAFRPLRRPAIPACNSRASVRTPVDAFLLRELERHGLGFAPEAARESLIRRVYFDLLGLPPSPEELAGFLADPEPDAYERLVDRLLASPHYGERWGRHWLDAAGYADSDGYSNEDRERPYAYKYRDYVIRALNEDKPLAAFVTEQLAGDELALTTHPSMEQAVQDPQTRQMLVATGFLRMAADGTGGGGLDQDAARNAVMADTLKIVSTSLLGLSVGCAQCHDHRYDPIPQSDYYRLRAVFEPAYDWKRWKTPAERLVSCYTAEDRQRAAAIETQAQELTRERQAREKQLLDEALEKHLERFDAALRSILREAQKTPADKRSEAQKQLLAAHPSVNIHPGVLYQYNPKAADELKAMDTRIGDVRARRPPEDFIQVLSEPAGEVPVTYLFHRGDPKQPRAAIGPGTLSVLSAAEAEASLGDRADARATSGRRTALARWLTSRSNPLLTRVWVNRVWMHHFGRGLSGTPADLGLQGERPSHPELLEWLASAFTSEAAPGSASDGLGWSFKRLHRLILLSTAYRQSARPASGHETVDPENRWYGRRSLQRLDAECIRDAMLASSGQLNPQLYGAPVPVRDDLLGQVVVGIDKKVGDNKMPVDVPLGPEAGRRSVYVQVRRSKPLTMLHVFDAPVMEVNCERRTVSTVAPQGLLLMNSDEILALAARLAQRLEADAGRSPRQRIIRAWQLAYGRSPTAPQIERAIEFVTRHTEALADSAPATPAARAPAQPRTPESQAWVNFCQTLFMSNEFLYLD